MNTLPRIFVYGFPSKYGGAGTELHHQILLWRMMGMEVHIIPSGAHYVREPLYRAMLSLGVVIHGHNEWCVLTAEDAILGFCNAEFLEHLPHIRHYTRKTVFVNCMTWLFSKEKQRYVEGMIGMFLYQNDNVRLAHETALKKLDAGINARFKTFKPYFEDRAFPFVENREDQYFGCGRISRQDADKYASSTLHVYEYFVATVPKRGLFVGYDQRSEAKIGTPPEWISTVRDGSIVSQQQFYRHCNILLQPTDTTENWPRVGFEAMASGSVLIVDDRGGWRQMVQHGKTGWLCRNERDFIYYASKMAYEPELRCEMAQLARLRGRELGGEQVSRASWGEVFDDISRL